MVVTALGDATAVGLPISILELTLYEKKIKGSLFGSSNPPGRHPPSCSICTAPAISSSTR